MAINKSEKDFLDPIAKLYFKLFPKELSIQIYLDGKVIIYRKNLENSEEEIPEKRIINHKKKMFRCPSCNENVYIPDLDLNAYEYSPVKFIFEHKDDHCISLEFDKQKRIRSSTVLPIINTDLEKIKNFKRIVRHYYLPMKEKKRMINIMDGSVPFDLFSKYINENPNNDEKKFFQEIDKRISDLLKKGIKEEELISIVNLFSINILEKRYKTFKKIKEEDKIKIINTLINKFSGIETFSKFLVYLHGYNVEQVYHTKKGEEAVFEVYSSMLDEAFSKKKREEIVKKIEELPAQFVDKEVAPPEFQKNFRNNKVTAFNEVEGFADLIRSLNISNIKIKDFDEIKELTNKLIKELSRNFIYPDYYLEAILKLYYVASNKNLLSKEEMKPILKKEEEFYEKLKRLTTAQKAPLLTKDMKITDLNNIKETKFDKKLDSTLDITKEEAKILKEFLKLKHTLSIPLLNDNESFILKSLSPKFLEVYNLLKWILKWKILYKVLDERSYETFQELIDFFSGKEQSGQESPNIRNILIHSKMNLELRNEIIFREFKLPENFSDIMNELKKLDLPKLEMPNELKEISESLKNILEFSKVSNTLEKNAKKLVTAYYYYFKDHVKEDDSYIIKVILPAVFSVLFSKKAISKLDEERFTKVSKYSKIEIENKEIIIFNKLINLLKEKKYKEEPYASASLFYILDEVIKETKTRNLIPRLIPKQLDILGLGEEEELVEELSILASVKIAGRKEGSKVDEIINNVEKKIKEA